MRNAALARHAENPLSSGATALLVGAGVIAAGGVAYAIYKGGSKWTPLYDWENPQVNPLLFAIGPGIYRVEFMMPPVPEELPKSQKEFMDAFDEMAKSHMTIRGAWLGAYAYPNPANLLPSDWPKSKDAAGDLLRLRIEFSSNYDGVTLTDLFPMAHQSPLTYAFRCNSCPGESSPVGPQFKWHVSGTKFFAGERYRVSLTPVAGMTAEYYATKFAEQGFAVLKTWPENAAPSDWPTDDLGTRWRYEVIYGAYKPLEWPGLAGAKVYEARLI